MADEKAQEAVNIPAEDGGGDAMSEERQVIKRVLENQNASFGLLSEVFGHEITQEQLDGIARLRLPAETGNADLDAGYRNLVRYMNHSWERTRTLLATDFFHTFLGATQDANMAAYPYESVYTSPDRLLMQKARDEVLACYRAQHVVLRDDINEPEDHIAFELEFVQLMGQRAVELLDDPGAAPDAYLEPLRVSRDFLERHLLNWVPLLTRDVDRISRELFYRAFGQILMGVLEVHREVLGEILS